MNTATPYLAGLYVSENHRDLSNSDTRRKAATLAEHRFHRGKKVLRTSTAAIPRQRLLRGDDGASERGSLRMTRMQSAHRAS